MASRILAALRRDWLPLLAVITIGAALAAAWTLALGRAWPWGGIGG